MHHADAIAIYIYRRLRTRKTAEQAQSRLHARSVGGRPASVGPLQAQLPKCFAVCRAVASWTQQRVAMRQSSTAHGPKQEKMQLILDT